MNLKLSTYHCESTDNIELELELLGDEDQTLGKQPQLIELQERFIRDMSVQLHTDETSPEGDSSQHDADTANEKQLLGTLTEFHREDLPTTLEYTHGTSAIRENDDVSISITSTSHQVEEEVNLFEDLDEATTGK